MFFFQGMILLWKDIKLFAVFYSLGNVTALARLVTHNLVKSSHISTFHLMNYSVDKINA